MSEFESSRGESDSEKDMTSFSRCLCRKMLPTLQWIRQWYSGVINYTDMLCGDCRKEFASHPRIVCLTCRSLMGFVEPYKDKITGFSFEKGKHYHIASCPKCNPKGGLSSTVIEHDRHCKANKVKVVENEDLIQEVEQKLLQGKRASDRLMSEIRNSPSRHENKQERN